MPDHQPHQHPPEIPSAPEITLTDKNQPFDVTLDKFLPYPQDPIRLFQMLHETQVQMQSVIDDLVEELEEAVEELERIRADQQKPTCQRSSLEERLTSDIACMDAELANLLAAQATNQHNAIWLQQETNKAAKFIGSMAIALIDMIPKYFPRAARDELKRIFQRAELSLEQADFPSETDNPQLRFRLSLADEIAYKQAKSKALTSKEVSEEPGVATPDSDILMEEEHDPYQALDAVTAQDKENEARERVGRTVLDELGW